MTVKRCLFLSLSFLTFAFMACDQDSKLHGDPMPPPSASWFTIPSERFPVNSRLIVASTPEMDADSLTIRIGGISGKVTVKRKFGGAVFLFEPASTLPLGKTTVEVQGKAVDGRNFGVIDPPVREIEVIAPDSTPPTLVGTEPPDRRAAQFLNENEIPLVFSEPILWFDAKASIEPGVMLNAKNQPVEIQSDVFVHANVPNMVKVYPVPLDETSYPLHFQKGVTYQVTLQGITDLAGNPAENVQRVYKLP